MNLRLRRTRARSHSIMWCDAMRCVKRVSACKRKRERTKEKNEKNKTILMFLWHGHNVCSFIELSCFSVCASMYDFLCFHSLCLARPLCSYARVHSYQNSLFCFSLGFRTPSHTNNAMRTSNVQFVHVHIIMIGPFVSCIHIYSLHSTKQIDSNEKQFML